VTLLHGNQPSFLEMLVGLVENEADALVRLGRAGATFFCSTKNIAFADVRMAELGFVAAQGREGIQKVAGDRRRQ
jgi:hypothetical protein